MSEIIGSLFGVTADQYERNRQLEQDRLAFQLAQADPDTYTNFLAQSGGRGLGNIIGRALGGEDPELQRISRRQQIMGMIDPNQPETFEMAAQAALEGGDQQLAFGLRMEGANYERKRLESDALIFQRMKEKEALAPEKVRVAQAVAERAGPVGSPEYNAAYDAYLNPAKPIETQVVETATGQILINKATGEVLANLGKSPDRSTRVNTEVKLPPQASKFQEGLGAGQAKFVIDSQTAAQDAADILSTNQVGRTLLDSGAITGTGANLFVALNNALTQAGLDFGNADAAANSQAYAAALGSNVGKLITQFGAGTGLSDGDRLFATQMAAGDITLTEASLRKILDINDRAASKVIDRHNKRVKGIESSVPLTVEKPTFGAPPRASADQIPGQRAAPIYATNGKERIMSTDGGKTWGPAR